MTVLISRGFAFTVIASVILVRCSAGDQNVPQESTQGPLHVKARLVQLEVVACDPNGASVRDLSRRDFTVLDENQPRNIAFFSTVGENAAVATTTPSHPLAIDNQSAVTLAPATATVLLLDSLNMRRVEDLLYVRRELPKFLNQLKPGDAVAIYHLAGPIIAVVHGFSDNVESLIQAAESGRGDVGKWLHSANVPPDMAERRVRIEWTIAALQSIALHLAAVPGRKNLVWVSGAFPLTLGFESTDQMANGVAHPQHGDLEPYRDRLKRLATTLNRVDIALYPVDPEALQVDPMYQMKFRATAPPMTASRPLQSAGEIRQGDYATMDLLASETGGRAFYSANALGQSIQSAMNDSRFTYALGFYADEASWDGKTHRIEVRVSRPGVTVRSRRSYFAGDPPVESPADREAALRTAAATMLNGTAIHLTVNVASNPLRGGPQQIGVHVDPRDIQFEISDQNWRADFDLLITQNAPDGRRIAGERSQCLIHRETYAQARDKPLSLTRRVEVDTAAATVRVLVRDSATSAVGSVAIPVGRHPQSTGAR